jgi:hypothetical protein
MHDQAAARALKPHVAVVSPPVQIAASLVLGHKRYEGIKH